MIFVTILCISNGICFSLPYPRQFSSLQYKISHKGRLIYWIDHLTIHSEYKTKQDYKPKGYMWILSFNKWKIRSQILLS